MSVLIKGMEMPKDCFMCYLSRLNGERLFCNVTGEEVLRYKIAPECPMTEPTESAERKHGKWEEHGEPNEYGKYEVWYYACSFCGQVGLTLYNFCPNCGAYMRGDSDV